MSEKLEQLYLNNIGKLEGLKINFSNLKTLSLSHNNLNDNFLGEILNSTNKLKTLDLRNNKLKAINTITKHSKKLVKLNLANNQITRISGIQLLKNLDTLDLSTNNISIGLDKLGKLCKLKTLNLSNNPIEDFNFLNNLNKETITKLILSNLRLIEFSKDLKFANIEHLDLSNNLIEFLDLEELERIDTLNLSNNRLEKLLLKNYNNRPLRIDASNNNIRYFEAGGAIEEIKKINLSNNNLERIKIKDRIEFIEAIIDLNYNNITVLPQKIINYIHNYKAVEAIIKNNRDPYNVSVINNPIEMSLLKYYSSLNTKENNG